MRPRPNATARASGCVPPSGVCVSWLLPVLLHAAGRVAPCRSSRHAMCAAATMQRRSCAALGLSSPPSARTPLPTSPAVQGGIRSGDPSILARDLQHKLGELQVSPGRPAGVEPADAPGGRPAFYGDVHRFSSGIPHCTAGLNSACSPPRSQRTSRELDSSWRMQVVRQGAARIDMWKRCATPRVKDAWSHPLPACQGQLQGLACWRPADGAAWCISCVWL